MAGEDIVVANIAKIYERRRAALYALAVEYAAKAINSFRIKQRNGTFWSNQTGIARDTMFTQAFTESDVIGFLMAHMVEYGVYLELANNGVHEAIRPTMMIYAPLFIKAAKELFKDAA